MTSRKPRRTRMWTIVWIVAASGLALAMLAVAAVAYLFWHYGRDLASLDQTAFRNYRPAQVTRVLARDGTVIGELFEQRRTVVSHDQIPAHVENAFLAAEDARFYEHAGMDVLGMVRALVANVQKGRVTQGASTITQQVVKNFALSPERTLERKVQEIILARRLEGLLTKREILELYLNDIYFGHGRYGVEEAARFFFHRSIGEVDLGQAALLAALPKAPSKTSPLRDPQRAKARQIYVLRQMVRHGFASEAEAQAAIAAPLPLASDARESRTVADADEFVDVVAETLRERYGDRVATLGATVTTTVDLDLQRAARRAVRTGLTEVDARRRVVRSLTPAAAGRRDRLLSRDRVKWTPGRLVDAVVLEQDESADTIVVGVGPVRARVHVPVGRYHDADRPLAEQFPTGSITRVEPLEDDDHGSRAQLERGPEGLVVLLEAESGEVAAMIGGDTYRRAQFNRVLAAKRQPGSAFKPLVYGAALASRQFTAASIVADSPEIYEKWRPTNFERHEYRGKMRVREALTHSVNTVAIKLLDAIGPQAVHEFAYAAGIQSELVDDLSLALGTSEVTPIELAEAYLTVARGGSRRSPTFIRKIEVPGGTDWTPPDQAHPGIDPDVAFVLTSMMTSVVGEGTGRRAKALGRPVAGKTGTSADHRDAWFGGFTRDHVALAWVGFDRPRRIGRRETGARAALPIWLATMRAASDGQPIRGFVPPPTVDVRTIDAVSGLLAGAPRPSGGPTGATVEEFFIAGTAPVETAAPTSTPHGDLVLDLYE
ncbi:MAG: PBP1A family penicillin-binding protein [Myxococcales bacterium FL481]|nr:MAG: PBP1A family penicillin-binding protein [Myxococcales bacterium FL481]